MLVAILDETVLDLAAVTTIVPPAKGRREPGDPDDEPAPRGKRTHISTILRWIMHGAKAPDGTRVRLEAVRLGGRWLTSREALQRFVQALTPRVDGADPEPEVRTPARRQKASEHATKEVERYGI
jgi:hypothetical protein